MKSISRSFAGKNLLPAFKGKSINKKGTDQGFTFCPKGNELGRPWKCLTAKKFWNAIKYRPETNFDIWSEINLYVCFWTFCVTETLCLKMQSFGQLF